VKKVYSAKFTVVYGGSTENDKYFDATPSGYIELGTFKQDFFEVGKSYYLDFTPVEEATQGG
jgi:hypothetical protein